MENIENNKNNQKEQSQHLPPMWLVEFAEKFRPRLYDWQILILKLFEQEMATWKRMQILRRRGGTNSIRKMIIDWSIYNSRQTNWNRPTHIIIDDAITIPAKQETV